MKGIKWKQLGKFVALLTSVFVIFVINSVNTNALGFKYDASLNITTATVSSGNSDTNYFAKSGEDWWVNRYSDFNHLYIYSEQDIPANSLVSLDITYTYHSNTYSSNMYYYGLAFRDSRPLLYDSCSNINNSDYIIPGQAQAIGTFTCHYVFHQSSPSHIIESVPGSHIVVPVAGWQNSGEYFNIVIHQPKVSVLTNDGLSDDDRTWLENVLSTTGGEVSQVVQELQEQKAQDQQDRQDLENQQSDTEDSGEEAGQQISNASGNLITIIGNFFNILQHPNTSDCTIDGDMGHMDLGQIDLCQLPVPPAIGVIATILMIGVIIPVVISIINTLSELIMRLFA